MSGGNSINICIYVQTEYGDKLSVHRKSRMVGVGKNIKSIRNIGK